jgi:hypothetical protein
VKQSTSGWYFSLAKAFNLIPLDADSNTIALVQTDLESLGIFLIRSDPHFS